MLVVFTDGGENTAPFLDAVTKTVTQKAVVITFMLTPSGDIKLNSITKKSGGVMYYTPFDVDSVDLIAGLNALSRFIHADDLRNWKVEVSC